METYIGNFEKNENVITETVYNSSNIQYFRKYTIGTSNGHSDHSALFVEHIFNNRENSIIEFNLWREYNSISKEGLKALEMLKN